MVHPPLSVTVTLRDYADDEAGDTQKIVEELNGHRPHVLAKFHRDQHRIAEDRKHTHNHQRGEARDAVDREEMHGLGVVHDTHAGQIADQSENLQDPVEVLVGATRERTRKNISTYQDDDGLRHQQDVLRKDKIDS